VTALLQVWVVEAFSVAGLIALGLFSSVGNKNTVKILMGISIMTRGCSLAFLVAGVHHANLAVAQSMIITIIVVDAAITALGLSMVVNIYRQYGSVETDKLKRLHG
jgi:multisubunit Na+/H+ antiporter MnhC subunit